MRRATTTIGSTSPTTGSLPMPAPTLPVPSASSPAPTTTRSRGNDFCGNFSAEYGGAISHYGRSNNGSITQNRIYYNQGYDEGGGIFVAGALPANNNALTAGAGSVTIDGNTVISNQSNDDGGGIRFLMASGSAGNFAELVENNIIANNLSTHEGGGVALDDSANVTLVNNTIVKNITTATAATNAALADGIKPANPAGLSSGGNSALLQANLPNNSPNWSKPRLLNNIFADNRAGWAVLPLGGQLQRECNSRHRRLGRLGDDNSAVGHRGLVIFRSLQLVEPSDLDLR